MKSLRIFILILLVVGIFACANPGVPSGGEKDEIPPQITKTLPANYSTKFDKKRIVIDFDEFIKLNNAAQNVVISPPQKKSPKVRLKERAIVVDIRDSLRPNTTYTIDFGKAIVDNNEGNELGEYRYVFTTGEKIDNMGLAGFVKGAKVDTISEGAKVALYTPSDTLNPYRLLPDYIAQTDTLGFFMFNNIQDRTYKIIAFQDENNNNMLDAEEPMAFQTENIHTSATVESEEIPDSLQLDKYTKFKHTNLQLRIFKPIPTQQYLVDYKRPMREKIELFFNAPRKDSLKMELLGIDSAKFYVEKTKNNDSLTYWIADKEIANVDTLLVKLSYLRTDTIGELVEFNDTLKFTYKEPKKKKSKKKDGEDEEKSKIEFMEIKTNMSGKINYFDTLFLSFDLPIQQIKKEDITLFTEVDTTEVSAEFTLQKDSVLPFRKFHLITELKPEMQYGVRIDSMKIYDISGKPNKEVKTTFQTYDKSYYGKIFVSVTNGEQGVLVQLVSQKKPDVVVAEKPWVEGGRIDFTNLPPDTYLLKALWDTNGNGKWDTGDYQKQVQPEQTAVFAKEIELPSNWELEVAWTLDKDGIKRRKQSSAKE